MTIWKQEQFLRYFVASTIGSLGDWFDIFAMRIIFVHIWHASPILLSVLVLSYFLPSIILGPIAGVWVDRLCKRNIMLFTDLLSCVFTIAILFSSGVTMALVFVLLRGAVASFNQPAQQAFVKHVVHEEYLLQASSYSTVSFQMCKVVGPMLGGLALLVVPVRACIGLNAFSFFVSALVVSSLRSDTVSTEVSETKKNWSRDILTGITLIWENKLLKLAVMLVMLWFYFSLLRQTQLVIFLQHVMPDPQGALGLFMGLDGLGAVTSSLLLGRNKSHINYANFFLTGFTLLAVGILGIGIYQPSWPNWIIYACAPVIGLGTGVVLVAYGYLLKKEASHEQIGRVSATSSALQNFALACGTLSSGFLVVHFGIREVYLTLSLAMFILALISFGILRKHHIYDNSVH